mgnify:CR=1 FL=1
MCGPEAMISSVSKTLEEKGVSFDKILFKKELKKSISWLKKEELTMLKIWCLATFGKHKDIILDTFENVI